MMRPVTTRTSVIRSRSSSAVALVARSHVTCRSSSPSVQQKIQLAVGSVALSLVLNAAPSMAAGDAAAGALVFNNNCAACHQGGRNVVIPDHTLDQAAIEKFLDGGYNLDAIIYQVENGKGAMPAWADRLSEEEILDVAQYVFETAAKGW